MPQEYRNAFDLVGDILGGFEQNLRTRQALDFKRASEDFDRSLEVAKLKQGARRLDIDESIRQQGVDIRKEDLERKKIDSYSRFYKALLGEQSSPKTFQAALIKLRSEGKGIDDPEVQAILELNEEFKQKQAPALTPLQRKELIDKSFSQRESDIVGQGAERLRQLGGKGFYDSFGADIPKTGGQLRALSGTVEGAGSDPALRDILSKLTPEYRSAFTSSEDSLFQYDPFTAELLYGARQRQNGQKQTPPQDFVGPKLKWQELGYNSEEEFNQALEAELKRRGLQ